MNNVFDKYLYRVLLLTAVTAIGTGTIVYHFAEKISWVDAYYFSVVTLSTVGYGDIVPTTTFTKIFTTFYIFVGVGILTTFLSVTMRRRGEKFQDKHKDKIEKSEENK
jgi:voltage-gated potassium channel